MDIPYQKRSLKRGQCRFCTEIHKKFTDLLRHEAIHRFKKEEHHPEVAKEPGKEVIKKEPDIVDIINMQTPFESLRDANVQMDESPEAGILGESSHLQSYKCHKCSQEFKHPRYLYGHMKSHFPEMLENQKNVQTNKVQKYVKDGGTRDVILSLEKVDQAKEYSSIYKQALKKLNPSLPEVKVETGMIFGPKQPIRRRVRKSTNSGNPRVDPDAQIKERIRNYDLTKDFRKVIEGGKVAYKCKICSFRQMGQWKNQLFQHTFVHTGERLYQCQMCPKRFKNPQCRKVHERIHTGQRPFKCQLCSKGFKQSSNLSYHMKSHSSKMQKNEKNAQTRSKARDYVNLVTRDDTDRMHQDKNPHLNSQALQRPKSSLPVGNPDDQQSGIQEEIRRANEMDLDLETEIKFPELPYKCIICSELFGDPMTHNHQKIHLSNDMELQDDVPQNNQPEILESSSNIQNISIKSEEIEISVSSIYISQHRQKSHVKNQKLKKTPSVRKKSELPQETEKIQDFSAYFKLGLVKDVNVSLYRVNQLEEYSQVYSQALNRLNATSLPRIYPYKESPVKSFAFLAHFKKLGDGRFECLKCHQNIKRPKEHYLIHFPPSSKPYCKICSKEFSQFGNLNAHMKAVHLGIKRIKPKRNCRYCGKTLMLENLRDHEDSHQGIKRHICKICSERFNYKAEYYQHMKKHSRMDPIVQTVEEKTSKGNQEEQIPEIKNEIEAFTEEDFQDIEQAISNAFN